MEEITGSYKARTFDGFKAEGEVTIAKVPCEPRMDTANVEPFYFLAYVEHSEYVNGLWHTDTAERVLATVDTWERARQWVEEQVYDHGVIEPGVIDWKV